MRPATQPPSLQPTAEERDLQGWIAARKRFGFRHGARVRAPARRARTGSPSYGFPATKREIDYLWLRADLTRRARAASAT